MDVLSWPVAIGHNVLSAQSLPLTFPPQQGVKMRTYLTSFCMENKQIYFKKEENKPFEETVFVKLYWSIFW